MNKELLIEKPSMGARFSAYFLDLGATILGTITMYFIILYMVFATGFNYIGNSNYINQIYDEYNLNIGYDTNYEQYEQILQKIYFEDFKDEILEDYKNEGKDYSIEYIYNVVVLNLPEKPTVDTYSNSLYRYVQNPDGSYNVNVLGVKEEGSGEFYERSMADLFYASYTNLPNLLRVYLPDFNKAFVDNANYEAISRAAALVISASGFYILMPFINKNGSTIFEKINKIGYVNKNNYLEIKKRKIPLRPLILFLIPLIGLIFYNNYTLVILIILPLFLNPLAILLSKKNHDFFEMICFVKACDLESSNIFKTKEELDEFTKKVEIENKDFLDNLKNIGPLNMVGRDEKND